MKNLISLIQLIHKVLYFIARFRKSKRGGDGKSGESGKGGVDGKGKRNGKKRWVQRWRMMENGKSGDTEEQGG